MIVLNDYFDSLCDIEVTLLQIITPFLCNAENCSDAEDRQYPICSMYMQHLCPLKKYNMNEITDKIINSLVVVLEEKK